MMYVCRKTFMYEYVFICLYLSRHGSEMMYFCRKTCMYEYVFICLYLSRHEGVYWSLSKLSL